MKKNQFFFVPNELKSPKNNMFFLHTRGGGWVGVSEASVYFYTLFLSLP